MPNCDIMGYYCSDDLARLAKSCERQRSLVAIATVNVHMDQRAVSRDAESSCIVNTDEIL